MKNLFLSLAFALAITHANAQWTIEKPLIIINNTDFDFNYSIKHHSAFYDGINDGIINGLFGPFNMNTIYSNWNADIITSDLGIADMTPNNSTIMYENPSIGLPVDDLNIPISPTVLNKYDFGLYFRTHYLKGNLTLGTIFTPGFQIKYPTPSPAGLTPIAGTTFSYDPSSSMLYDTSGFFQSFFFMPPGSVAGTSHGFIIQFTEVAGREFVICDQI